MYYSVLATIILSNKPSQTLSVLQRQTFIYFCSWSCRLPVVLPDLVGISCIYIFFFLFGSATSWGCYLSHGKSQEHKSTSQTMKAHLRSWLMSHPLTFVGQSNVNVKGAGKYIFLSVGGHYKVTWPRVWMCNLSEGEHLGPVIHSPSSWQ